MSSPGQLPLILAQVQTALKGGDNEGAVLLADQACSEGHEHPGLLTLAAHRRLQTDDPAGAHALASRARQLAPRSVDTLHALGLALIHLDRPREALVAFDAALGENAGLAMLYFSKAQAHGQLQEPEEIRRALENAIARDPGHAEALAWLANLAAQRSDTVAARDLANRALVAQPGHHGARLTLAMADVAEKNYAAAEQRLTPLLADAGVTPVNRAYALGLMGDLRDGQDRAKEAYESYAAAKAVLRQFYAPRIAGGGETAAARVARLAAYFRDADGQAWRARKTGQERPETRAERGPSGATQKNRRTHVFLLGFPRSGTTLLEQVLAGHPDIETMEERDAFIAAIPAFIASNEGLDRLASLSEAELEPWRRAYWDYAAEFGHRTDAPVFIDKMPLNTVLMPLIARLFPDAKILFALRDPRDVVLSCFRRHFGMNRQMYELTTLAGAAAYYDAVMDLAGIYRDKLALDLLQTRHEDLLQDFEGESRRLCAFLGLEWREEMKNFAQRARESVINTPSGAQLARGLTRAGEGQWRRYAEAMAPVLPQLAPWVAAYGYERIA